MLKIYECFSSMYLLCTIKFVHSKVKITFRRAEIDGTLFQILVGYHNYADLPSYYKVKFS